jgi:DNA-binding transcriptional LysR family regulator
MLAPVELREVRVFLALAEELHYGRTAERLELTPSRVSQIVRVLEARIGGRLFDRTSRRVTLTPEGERLRSEIAAPYVALLGAVERAHERLQQVAGELRLGLLFPSSGGPRLTQIVELFESRHPGAQLSIREVRFDDPLGPLRRGEIDVMACRLPIEQPDLAVGPILSSDARIVAVATGHPLATRASVSVEDLADYEAHDAGNRLPREYLDTLIPPQTPSGREIRRRHMPTPSPSQVLATVATGAIVHPTISSFPDHFRHPGVTFVPIRDLPPMRSGLVWRKARETAAVRAFASAAAEAG